MRIPNTIAKEIITKVLKSQDHRIHVQSLINSEFLLFAIDFFREVVNAKLESKDITLDWYKLAFMNEDTSKDSYAIASGLNMKTIGNMYGTTKRQVVVEASEEHLNDLYVVIKELTEKNDDIDLTLTIKLKGVSVDLNVSESLIVINTLAVKRSALRGGIWSTVGKRVEKPLMLTLCKLFKVPTYNYDSTTFQRLHELDVEREIDFFLVKGEKRYKCEVKLMGKGNPESADVILARDTDVFVADTLSEQNKAQCEQLNVKWVACKDPEGFKRFGQVLTELGIPHQNYNGNLDEDLPIIFTDIF